MWLSSKAFHYDYWDRRAYYRGKKPLPPKVGSFQAFLQGYEGKSTPNHTPMKTRTFYTNHLRSTDASVFFRKHPWPDSTNSGFRTDAVPRKRGPLNYTCVPSGTDPDEEDIEERPNPSLPHDDPRNRKFVWSEVVQQQFREELEKLVILDYIMRNTDRGLDNWMIKIEWPDTSNRSATSGRGAIPPHLTGDLEASSSRPESPGYQPTEPMTTSRSSTPLAIPRLRIGAIDNSLAFPWKHPDQWRSFPFG